MASKLLNLLPGGRLKVFHRCMEGTCCMLKMFFLGFCAFDFVLFVSSFAFAALKFKHDVELSMKKRPRED